MSFFDAEQLAGIREFYDELIESFGVPCTLFYQFKFETGSTNLLPADSTFMGNIGAHGGPIQSQQYNSGGTGQKASQATESITLVVDWTIKDHRMVGKTVYVPFGFIKTMGHLSDLPKIQRAIELQVNTPSAPIVVAKYKLVGSGEDIFRLSKINSLWPTGNVFPNTTYFPLKQCIIMANTRNFDDFREKLIEEVTFRIDSQVAEILQYIKHDVTEQIRLLIKDSIYNSPEYIELTSNSRTFHEIGIPNITVRLGRLISIILKEVKFEYELKNKPRARKNVYFSFRITMLGLDYNKLFSYATSVFETEKGETLPWLEWLLTAGTTPVVLDGFYINRPSRASRTGLGFMVPHGSWHVPSSVAGTQDNNWLTRAVDSVNFNIKRIIEEELRIYLG